MGYVQVVFDGINGYRIINETDDVISFGAEYSLEKYIDGEWVSVLDENQPCVLILYHLEAYSSEVYPLGVDLECGMYRLGKNIGFPNKSEALFLKCDIFVE